MTISPALVYPDPGLSDLPEALLGLSDTDPARGVIVVLPGELLSLHDAAIPARTTEDALEAAPFVLEDDLAQDPALLHFALMDRQGDLRRVAVLAREVMEAVTAAVRESGHRLVAVVPDICLLGDPPEVRAGLRCGERVLIHGGETPPIAVDSVMLQTLAPVTGEVILRDVERDDLLALFAARIATLGEALPTLMQGRYAPGADVGAVLRPWRRAALLAAAVLGLWVAGMAADIWRLNWQVANLEAGTERIFREAMPEVTRMVNPRAQLRAALIAGGGADRAEGSGRGFLDHVAILYAALDAQPSVRLEALRYDGQSADGPLLTARLSYGAFADIEQLRAGVEQAGGLFSEGSASQSGGRISGDVVVRMP